MFYKVIKDGKIIDLLNHPIWIKYQAKHDVMLTCPINEAEGVMSSDGKYFWHVDVFPSIKKQDVDTVSLVEIDVYEYNKLRTLNMKTPQEIIDAYTLDLIMGGVL